MSDLFKFIANLHRKTGRYSKLNRGREDLSVEPATH